MIISLVLISVVLFSASSVFAADDNNATLGQTDEIAVEETINSVEVIDDATLAEAVAVDGNANEVIADNATEGGETVDVTFNVTSDVVTQENFFNYFDESGSLLENVTSDELIFNGDFSNINVSYITIDKPIKFTGNDVAFTGVTFVIGADDVTVDGFTLTQSDVYLFYIEGTNNVTLSNNILNFNAIEGFDGYAVYANAVSALNLINNTITYVGTTDGTVRNNAIRISGDEDNEVPATDVLVQGNIFNIRLPSVDVYYDPYTYEASIQSEGIAFYYCDGVDFIDNNVFVWHTENGSGVYDTIYGVGFRGNPYNFDADEPIMCYNVVVANNEITTSGLNFMYALCISADGFEIYNNTIDANSLNNYANAITVDGPSCDGEIYNNQINVLAPEKAYGIYSYQYMGAIEDISYYNNDVTVIGYAACGMELVECNTVALNNTITARGNYTYGIVASIRDEGEFSGNKVYSLGNNNGTASTGDPLMPLPSMGITVKGDALISFNEIESTGIAVNIVKDSEITLNNNNIALNANEIINAYAIYAVGVNELNIIDNNISYVASSNGAVFTNVIRVSGDEDNEKAAKDISVVGNTFDIKIPSVAVYYDPYTYEATTWSEAILFYYCEDVSVVDNKIDLTYNGVVGAYDSIYVISFRGNPYNFDAEDPIICSDVVISNNTIDAEGHTYIYGIFVSSDYLEVSNNNICVSSDINYANGIDIEGPSSDGIVTGNDITVTAPNNVYAIYSAQYNGAIENMTYVENNVNAYAYAACGMELIECNPYVSDNEFRVYGNYTFGIVASIRDNGTFVDNFIRSVGVNVGNDTTGDSLLPKTSMGISIKGSNVVENNDIYSTAIGINLVEEGPSTISNNNISVWGHGLVDNYAIYAFDVDDISIIDNVINYVGNTDGTVINNAIRISGNEDKERIASGIKVNDNTLVIVIPSVDVYFDPVTWESTVMAEGVLFYYCEDVEFENNNVTFRYNGFTTAYGYDTLYVVSVRGNPYNFDAEDPIICSDVSIVNNTIDALGHTLIYGISASGNDLEISKNSLLIVSDGYYANGIDIEGPAEGDVFENNIDLSSTLVTYGIFSSQTYGGVWNMSYSDNFIAVASYAACGMELMEKNPVVTGNKITAIGNYTYGIVASINEEAQINENSIFCLGTNEGNTSSGDSLLPFNSIGVSTKGLIDLNENNISSSDIGVKSFDSTLNAFGNTIKATGDYAIVLDSKSNATIVNNYLAGKKGVGNNAVIGGDDVILADNGPDLKVVMIADNVEMIYGDDVDYVLNVVDENGDPIANITVYIATGLTGFSLNTTENGEVRVPLNDWDVGNYTIVASFEGNGVYAPKSIESTVTIGYKSVIMRAGNIEMVYGGNDEYGVWLMNTQGAALANATVAVNIGDAQYNLTTDETGYATLSLKSVDAGNYTVVASFAGNAIYGAESFSSTLTVTPKATNFAAAKTVNVLLTAIKKGYYYEITLKDASGKVLANKKVTITFNGKTYTKTTNSKGLIKFKLASTTTGNKKLTMKFAGDNNYKATSKTATIKITKEATKLVASSASFNVNKKTKVVKVTLKDSKNKGVGGVKITLRVNGVNYVAKTVSSGVANVKITKLNKVGSFGASIKFAGNNYYKAASKAIKITVKK